MNKNGLKRGSTAHGLLGKRKTLVMRKAILYSIYLFAGLTAVLLSGCCKDQNPNKRGCQSEKPITETGPFPLGVSKDYLYFKPGSWWVYKNNLSNELDSIVTLICDTSSISFKEDYPSTIYKTTFTTINIYQQSFTFNYNILYRCDKISPSDYHFFLHKNTLFSTKSENSDPYVYPFLPETYFIELLPTITIQGKTYSDVAVFQIWIDDSVKLPTLSFGFIASSPTKYFWAKGVGLIKIEQTLFRSDTQSSFIHKWELVSFNLIK